MVTVWVNLLTDLDFFWIFFGEMIVRVPFYYIYLPGSEYETSHSIILVRLCLVLVFGCSEHKILVLRRFHDSVHLYHTCLKG